MNIKAFNCIKDKELKNTAMLFHIALTEPGKYTISQIAKAIGQSREYVNSLLSKCLEDKLTLFEFYLDDMKINNLEKNEFIALSNSDQTAKLSVFSRAFFSNSEDKAEYDELCKSFSSTQSNKQRLMMFHSSLFPLYDDTFLASSDI